MARSQGQGQPAAPWGQNQRACRGASIAHRWFRGGIMNSTFSTEPITATSDCTPQQARYAKLLSLSSKELNAMAVRYHRLGGHVRLRLAEVFLAIQETAQYKGLGASGVIAYARNMRYEPSTVFEYMRIARKLLGLPVTTTALEHGVLSWSDVAEVTRVAEEETEAELCLPPSVP